LLDILGPDLDRTSIIAFLRFAIKSILNVIVKGYLSNTHFRNMDLKDRTTSKII